jgi:hypothetical protein
MTRESYKVIILISPFKIKWSSAGKQVCFPPRCFPTSIDIIVQIIH